MDRSSEQIVLNCEECKEKLVILGPVEDWCSRRAIFRCKCGQKIALMGWADEGILAAS